IGKATIATIQPHRRTTATQLEACSIISIIHIRTGQPVMTGRLQKINEFALCFMAVRHIKRRKKLAADFWPRYSAQHGKVQS
ncbi:hypothetical protein, partial [Undibacterium rugosum]|uniref:hypothetical protein n=1 Tax=Undibacterium rugosum TaxID=2762291 RepID=UPI001C9BB78F